MSNATLLMISSLAIGATIFVIYHSSEGMRLPLAPNTFRIGISDMGEDICDRRLENRMSLRGHNSNAQLGHRVRKKVS